MRQFGTYVQHFKTFSVSIMVSWWWRHSSISETQDFYSEVKWPVDHEHYITSGHQQSLKSYMNHYSFLSTSQVDTHGRTKDKQCQYCHIVTTVEPRLSEMKRADPISD
jgi:hypothetical protein